MSKPIRVVQWSTGVVGRPALKAIVAHPLLELVGCWCHSPDKEGQDAGTLCGLPPLGIRATRDIDALLAAKPDVVCYMPQFPKIDEMVKILEAGCDIVSTAYFITGTQFGPEAMERLRAATAKGGSSIYGGGVNPGHANIIALVASAIISTASLKEGMARSASGGAAGSSTFRPKPIASQVPADS